MPLDLYASKMSPPCRSVMMGLKQLNLDFNLKTLDMKNKEHLSPEFLKINPAHCIPTLVDGDLALWESRAILQYLFNKYAPNSSLYPNDPKKRAIIDRTLNFDVSYYSSIRAVLFRRFYAGGEPSEQEVTNFKNNLKLLDTLIGNNKYVAGNELTIADLSVVITTTSLAIRDFTDLNDVPNVKSWFERLRKELPYFEDVNGGVAEAVKERMAQIKQ